MPYPTFNTPTPYPPYALPGPSNAPPYPPYHIKSPFDTQSNSPAEGDQTQRSPSDDDVGIQYPTIADFFAELTETESNEHYFTTYTEAFHNNGYYRVNKLADKDLTVGHMMEIIDHLKEGTTWVIKNKVLNKVKSRTA
jgi:hypothetical protein